MVASGAQWLHLGHMEFHKIKLLLPLLLGCLQKWWNMLVPVINNMHKVSGSQQIREKVNAVPYAHSVRCDEDDLPALYVPMAI